MFSKIRKRFSYTNVVLTIALVFAMSGGAYAAKKYLITSTSQISPKVLKSLQGKAARRVHPAHRALKAPRVLKALKVLQARREPGRKARPARLVLLVPLVREQRAPTVRQAQQAPLGQPARQAYPVKAE